MRLGLVGEVEFPKWKGTLNSVIATVGNAFRVTKLFLLGVTVAFNPSGTSSETTPPIDVSHSVQSVVQISRYSKKFLLKPAGHSSSLIDLIGHGSHSSHRSHSSHSSHSSHRSHSSHYSGSTSAPSAPAQPFITTPSKTVDEQDTLNSDFSESTGNWKSGILSLPAMFFDREISVGASARTLVITPRAAATGGHYSGYVTKKAWDLTNTTVAIRALEMGQQTAEAIFALVWDVNNWYRFVKKSSNLEFQTCIKGKRSEGSLPYSPEDHKLWRFRHDPALGILYWETSESGLQWRVRHALTAEIPLTSLSLELAGGTEAPSREPGKIIFNNLLFSRN